MPKRKSIVWMLGLAMVAGLAGYAPTFVPSTAVAATADEPTAEQIIEKSIEASGGRAALEKVKSREVTGTFAVPAQGMTATMQTYQKAPNLFYTKIDLKGFGVVEKGYNGDVAWEKTPQTGTRIIEGEEKAQMERETNMHNELNWKAQFPKVESKGVEEVNGKKCYKVELTDKDGNAQTRFYDVQTGLLDQLEMTVKSPMGEIPISTTMSDYRDVDGLKMPFKSTQLIKSMGMTYEMSTEKVVANSDIPSEKFELPDDVKELAKKPPASSPTAQPGK